MFSVLLVGCGLILGQAQDFAGRSPAEILRLLGAELREGASDESLSTYRRIFDSLDRNDDGLHTREEFVDHGRYLTPKQREKIFQAADSDGDNLVTREEYVLNRIITGSPSHRFIVIPAVGGACLCNWRIYEICRGKRRFALFRKKANCHSPLRGL